MRVKKFLNSRSVSGLTVRFGGQEHGDDVVGRVVSPFQRNVLGIAEDLEGSRGSEREEPVLLGVHLVDDDRGVFGVSIGDHLVPPGHQLVGIRLGHAEKAAEKPDRELPSDLGHEVELAET